MKNVRSWGFLNNKFHYYRTIKKNTMTIPKPILQEILVNRCYDFMVDQLTNTFKIDFEALCEYLRKYDGVIGGYFIIACLLNETNFGDLDIFISKYPCDVAPEEDKKLNAKDYWECTKEEKLKLDTIWSTWNPVIPMLKLFTTTVENKSVARIPTAKSGYPCKETITYIRRLYVDGKHKIDFVTVDKDQNTGTKNFLERNINLDFLKSWFDGDKFHFSFDVGDFVLKRREAKLLTTKAFEFEELYDPFSFGPGHNFEDYMTERNQDLFDQVKQLLEHHGQFKKYYPDDIESQQDHIRSLYVGEYPEYNLNDEKYITYAINKTFYRCCKYASRGIHITNIKDFFSV